MYTWEKSAKLKVLLVGRDPFTSNEYLFILKIRNQMMSHQVLAKLSAGNKRVVNRTETWGMS